MRPIILADQRRLRPNRLVMLRRDQFAVRPINETVEECLREELVGLSPRHAMFLDQSEGFGHRFDRRAEHEVARELDHVGGAWLIAEIKHALAHGLLQGPHPLSRSRGAGGRYPQLGVGRDLGLAEDWRGDVVSAKRRAVRGANVLIER